LTPPISTLARLPLLPTPSRGHRALLLVASLRSLDLDVDEQRHLQHHLGGKLRIKIATQAPLLAPLSAGTEAPLEEVEMATQRPQSPGKKARPSVLRNASATAMLGRHLATPCSARSHLRLWRPLSQSPPSLALPGPVAPPPAPPVVIMGRAVGARLHLATLCTARAHHRLWQPSSPLAVPTLAAPT